MYHKCDIIFTDLKTFLLHIFLDITEFLDTSYYMSYIYIYKYNTLLFYKT